MSKAMKESILYLLDILTHDDVKDNTDTDEATFIADMKRLTSESSDEDVELMVNTVRTDLNFIFELSRFLIDSDMESSRKLEIEVAHHPMLITSERRRSTGLGLLDLVISVKNYMKEDEEFLSDIR